MIPTRHTRAYLTPIILLAICLVFVDAGRYRSGGGFRSSGSRRGGSHRVSAPKTPVYIPKTPVYVPKPPVHVPPRSQSSSGSSFPQPHTPHNSGPTHAKDSSNALLNAEGGGRPRPGAVAHDSKQQSSPHQPSAPYEPVQKVNAGKVQSEGPSHGSQNPSGVYPPWANPSTSNGHGAGSNPHAPNIGVPHPSQPHGSVYPSSPYNPSQSNQPKPPGTFPLASAPYPPTHPAGPISHPISGAPQGMPTPHQNYPHPNSPHNVPPYLPPSSPYPSGHPQGMPLPSAPHIGFGSSGGVHQPIGAPHNYQPVGSSPMQPHGGYSQPTVIHNHYNGPPVGSPQNPAGHPVYGHQPAYGGAPMGQPFVPGQTVVVLPNQQAQQSSGPGLGQIFKEALVFSTVNAGVNRLINGPPHHHHDSQSVAQPAAPNAGSSTSTVTNTVIYNNQYGNPTAGANGIPQTGQAGQSAALPSSPTGSAGGGSPAFPAATDSNSYPAIGGSVNPGVGQPGAASPNPGIHYPTSIGTRMSAETSNNSTTNSTPAQVVPINSGSANSTSNQTAPPVQEFQYYVSNEELWNLTENLFSKDEINASRYVTLNLQKHSINPNATDESSGPLLHVRDEAFGLPTIQAIRDVYDSYEFNSTKKEIMTPDRRRQENIFLDVFLSTDIMTTAMRWLSSKGYVEPDDFEWKDTIRHIWMTKVNAATSGFERVFMAEMYPGPSILGAQNWIYFEYMELLRRINYMSYVEKLNLGDKASLVKINFKIDDVVKPNTTMLIGTPPELEMALYTICYYARPNDLCTVSLAGTKLNIYTHAFRYFGKDVLDLGLVFI